jgi:hypothetical protein
MKRDFIGSFRPATSPAKPRLKAALLQRHNGDINPLEFTRVDNHVALQLTMPVLAIK